MADRVILTDRRKELLREGYDPSEQTERNAMSRFRKSTRTALTEMIEIAESPHVDHTEFFDPDDVFRLLRALLMPSHELDQMGGGPISRDDYSDEFTPYHDRLRMQLAKLALASTMEIDMSDWTDENAPEWNNWRD